MRRYFLIFLSSLFLLGAAPSRTKTYISGQVISAADVTENEDNIFSYLQAGVDTYKAGTVDSNALGSTSVDTAELINSAVTTAKIAANAVDGTKIAVGSDAQGDVLYYNGTDYVRLGAGTSGQFLRTNGASANPSWAAAVSVKVGSFSRDMTTASGTQAVTGVGFQPVGIIFFGGDNGQAGKVSWGMDDATTPRVLADANASTTDTYSSTLSGASIYIYVTGSQIYEGKVNSFDTDGFTIGWTRTSTPSGTATISYIAFK